MTNNNLLFIREEEDGNIILRHDPQEEIQAGELSFKQRLLQGFGRLVLVALSAGTLAPATLHISTGFRPWVYVAFILWVFAYCAGMFNP
ncbi:MAG: hypothetical protein HGA79_07430 [Anaerolineales bacterium]|nr:hypothetical protein [Anaerolineales bacterium]